MLCVVEREQLALLAAWARVARRMVRGLTAARYGRLGGPLGCVRIDHDVLLRFAATRVALERHSSRITAAGNAIRTCSGGTLARPTTSTQCETRPMLWFLRYRRRSAPVPAVAARARRSATAARTAGGLLRRPEIGAASRPR